MDGHSSLGPRENIIAGLAYVGSIITGLIFFFSEKESKFVKFHSLQSILLFIITVAVNISIAVTRATIGRLPGIKLALRITEGVFTPLVLILFIIAMIFAFRNVKFKIPFIGKISEALIGDNI